MGVSIGDGVDVGDGVGTPVEVGVDEGVNVAVGVTVGIGVAEGSEIGAGDCVGEGLDVAVGERIGVGVGVGVGLGTRGSTLFGANVPVLESSAVRLTTMRIPTIPKVRTMVLFFFNFTHPKNMSFRKKTTSGLSESLMSFRLLIMLCDCCVPLTNACLRQNL